jgi:tetratricopeptide (TPR) repeat protein
VDPNHINALYNKGSALYSLGKYNESIQYFNKVLTMDPNNLDALVGKGSVLYESRQYTDAIKYYNKVLGIDPDNMDLDSPAGSREICLC